mgnify:CR=1 FL=1
MKRYNITSLKKYTDKTGAEKVSYPIIGTAFEIKNGGFRLNLNMFPNQDYFMFEQEEKKVEEGSDNAGYEKAQNTVQMPPNEPPQVKSRPAPEIPAYDQINPDDIPF